MSLINEALKKAQRSRHGDPAELAAPPMPGGATQISKRKPPLGMKTLVILGGGALVLIVLSVVVTVYLINRPAKPKTVAAAPIKKGSALPEVSPVIVPPIIKPVAPEESSLPPVAVAPTPAPKKAPDAKSRSGSGRDSTPKGKAPAAPPETAPPPLPTTPATNPPPPIEAVPPAAAKPAVAAQPDARVHAFVDSVRVSGVLPRGAESRVLINDRVYRLNDIVDRMLGVRLTKVEAASLTFSDANGVEYVKIF